MQRSTRGCPWVRIVFLHVLIEQLNVSFQVLQCLEVVLSLGLAPIGDGIHFWGLERLYTKILSFG